MANNSDFDGNTCHIRSALKSSVNHCQASLTEVEKVFLSALLIDKPSSSVEDEEAHKKKIERATKVLNDDILFSIPIIDDHKAPPNPTRSNNAQLDLWKAHKDGVRPKLLKEKSRRALSSGGKGSIAQSPLKRHANDCVDNDNCKQDKNEQAKTQEDGEEDVNSLDVLSDQEVGTINDNSTASSWNSSQGGFDHYDAWEVLRDEYAVDFGFKVAVDDENTILPCSVGEEAGDQRGMFKILGTSAEDEGPFGFKVAVDDENTILPCNVDEEAGDQRGMFKILGTSAEDARALPHVLSPPLMDSLLNFVPDHLLYDNFWLKFSLIRDGASLDILKRYCRAATHTILAIETTNGEVFGAFTSAPWRLNNQYFGTGESFLWRMRHGRNTPVHSLFEQAQLESEIDIFPCNGSNDYIQLCTSDKLALGGGTVLKKESSILEHEALDAPAVFLEDNLYGFGLALDENLLHGTTSPSATFGNSNLINSSGSGETFDVMNLEIWGFTSSQTERGAEKSEMSMFFVRESISSNLSSSSAPSTISLFSGDELSRDRFYSRVGQNDENESDRDAWQYANMMNPTAGSPYGKMGSPYGR
eukprot:CAMPEP_0201905428 /NCGR_PEP_ID=MMETSP0902-20130614/56503_1 /ASSEMBLY_ACC=CAM_ASM_000551 /TAXON_ID=420261 /ORGANISM="Thalassiosira antarctica, Strain CCMP982" /LENGTH=586 /DNA_ID=CAMNT_0048439541 /DNA_START=184 /DNA_END=1945 /DNA_ORIENTATION=+